MHGGRSWSQMARMHEQTGQMAKTKKQKNNDSQCTMNVEPVNKKSFAVQLTYYINLVPKSHLFV
jgi:hypothetical protein